MDKLEFQEERFVSTLTDLIGDAERLQNNPPRFVPQESLAVAHVRKVLDPFSEEQGGPLKIQCVEYKEGRGNLIVEYPVSAAGLLCRVRATHSAQCWCCCSFVVVVFGRIGNRHRHLR